MKYIGSEQHKENARQASKKATEGLIKKTEERKQEYYKNPKRCLFCNSPIEYKFKTTKKFCNSSCAAKYNNKGRVRSKESKEKVSSVLKKKFKTGELKPSSFIKVGNNNLGGLKYCKIKYNTCKICNRIFITQSWKSRKTCSKKCRVIASTQNRTYQNGSRKPSWYFNKWEDKKVLLESSWEVKIAELLDKLNIKWIRPKPIKWIDNNNQNRLYYPDFYLEKYNLYLDPKNPYCMEQDKEKMSKVIQLINIEYGSLDKIKKIVNSLQH